MPNRQSLLPVDPQLLFVVQLDALALQQDMQAAIAKPPAFGSKATQPLSKLTVIGARGGIAVSLWRRLARGLAAASSSPLWSIAQVTTILREPGVRSFFREPREASPHRALTPPIASLLRIFDRRRLAAACKQLTRALHQLLFPGC